MTDARRGDITVSLLLTSRLVPADAKPLSPGEYWTLRRAVPDLSQLVDGSAAAAAVDEQRLRALTDRAAALAIALEQLRNRGITPLTPYDDAYPQRLAVALGDAAPPLLYAAGDLSLMDVDGLGVVGSRGADEASLAMPADAGRWAAEHGWVVVSGAAKGVDSTAMNAAHAGGGRVVGVLSEGLDRRTRVASTRRAIQDGNVLLLSPYDPSAGFSVGNAMGRNKLVYALATVTLVVAADEGSGGTWAGATEALERGYGAVAVVGDSEPWASELHQRGARVVSSLSELDAPPTTSVEPVAVTSGEQHQLELL